MPAGLNLYKTAYCLDAYSKDGEYTDPIFKFEPNYFRGDTGESKDVQVWLRNDGDTVIGSVPDDQAYVYPIDLQGDDESTWVTLALTQAGLDTATPGANLDFPADLNVSEKFNFWIRVTVPADTEEQNKIDVRIAVYAYSLPLVTYRLDDFTFTYDIAARAANLYMSYDIESL